LILKFFFYFFLKKKIDKNTVALMETLFLHFVHILAHHSDINNYFNDSIDLKQKFEILNIFSKYVSKKKKYKRKIK